MPSKETGKSGLTSRILAEVRRRWPDEVWHLKVVAHPFQRAGVPDVLLCVRGRLIALEVKHRKPGESVEHARTRATAGQREQIRLIQQAGGYGAVVISTEEAIKLIEEALV